MNIYRGTERLDNPEPIGSKKVGKRTRLKGGKERNALCGPHATEGLGDTNVVGLELVQTNGSGESESTQEPVAEAAELRHTLGREVVDDSGPGLMLGCGFGCRLIICG